MNPEILFLAHRIPYPPDKGDKIRSWRILKFLCAHYRVHLACFADDPRDLDHQPFLESLCESVTVISLNPMRAKLKSAVGFLTGEPLSFRYFHHAQMKKAVEALRQKPLAAEIVFSSSMAPFVQTPVPGRKRLVDFCDCDSEKWRSYAQNAKPGMAIVYKREAEKLAQAESDIANWADASFAVTPEEASLFNNRPDITKKVRWFSNGVDTAFFDPENAGGGVPSHDGVFTGAMDYRANIEGVLYFMNKVWPAIRRARPEATFAIVGANPAPEITALDGKNGVTVTGRVDDIRPWIASALIAVAPLRVARGVQNKVLEAMAMEKAVIASPEAMTGINAPSDTAISLDTPEAMAQTFLALCNNGAERLRLGKAARRFVLATHQWDQALAPLENALKELGL